MRSEKRRSDWEEDGGVIRRRRREEAGEKDGVSGACRMSARSRALLLGPMLELCQRGEWQIAVWPFPRRSLRRKSRDTSAGSAAGDGF